MYWKTKPELTTNVADTRKAAKLTQAELALACSVTRQTIIAIEKGNYIPSVALALIIAKSLHTTVEKLFMLYGDKS